MKSDQELQQEWLRDHPVQRVKMRKPRSHQIQLSGRAVKGIRKIYSEVLRDHKDSFDPTGEQGETVK